MKGKYRPGLRLGALLLCLIMALSVAAPLVKVHAESLDELPSADEAEEMSQETADAEVTPQEEQPTLPAKGESLTEDEAVAKDETVSADAPDVDASDDAEETTEVSVPEELSDPWPNRTLTAESKAFDGTPVTITVEGRLPEDVTLTVKPIAEEEAAANVEQATETALEILAAFDVKLMQAGEEYEPEKGAVAVTFEGIGQNSVESADGEEAPEITVIHTHEDESVVIENVDVTDETVTIEIDQFSQLTIGIPTKDVDREDEDQFDQANQQYKEFKGGWMSKAFQWTDKENGKGQIILQMELDEAPESRAVYAFTPCTAHGFSQTICNNNINWLLQNYNHLDVIYITDHTYNGIHILGDVKSAQFTNQITWKECQHWGSSLYTGLYEYLTGKAAGSITSASYTGAGDMQKRFPTAIYVSFDLFGVDHMAPTTSDGNSSGLIEPVQYDCWPILYRYRMENRYFSSGLNDNSSTGGFQFTRESSDQLQNSYGVNLLTALIDPSLCPNLAALLENAYDHVLWNGDSVGIKTGKTYSEYTADYSYGETFAAQGAATYIPVTLVDNVDKGLVIKGYSYDSETSAGVPDKETGTKVNLSHRDQTFTVNYIKYNPGDIVTFTIDVEVNDNFDEVTFNEWFNSNIDDAVLTVDSNNVRSEQAIESPIAHIETVSYTATKVWDDVNDWDGYRPSSVTFTLYKVGQDGQLTEMAAKYQKPVWTKNGDIWTVTWNNLPQYTYVDNDQGGQDKVEVIYTCRETAVPNHYEMTQTGDTITNSHIPDKVEVTVTKVWEDSNNADGDRPDSVTVTLFADGKSTGKTLTLNEAGDWKGTFTDLPARNDATNSAVVYTVTENAVDGYRSSVEHESTFAYKFIATNTRLADLSGEKTWIDDNNADGARPDSITIHLYQGDTELDSKTVTAADGWKWTFTGLDKYDENGKEIEYTITEDEIDLYETEVDGNNVTNTYAPGPISYTVTKVWEDEDDKDGIRPDSIQVQLYADGETVGDPITLSEENEWTHTWEELESTVDGRCIVYVVKEVEVPEGYTAVVSAEQYSATVTNIHPEVTQLTVTKVWEDEDDKDGIRPDSIQVQLYADGKAQGEPVSVTADGNWTYTWTDLDQKQAGKDILYTVQEVNVPDGYEAEATVENGQAVITNTHEVQETSTPQKHTKWKGVVTGDSTMLGIYAVLLIAAGVGLAVIVYKKRKQK